MILALLPAWALYFSECRTPAAFLIETGNRLFADR
jgi:hypothetical protein